jgi:hypothetical protein
VEDGDHLSQIRNREDICTCTLNTTSRLDGDNKLRTQDHSSLLLMFLAIKEEQPCAGNLADESLKEPWLGEVVAVRLENLLVNFDGIHQQCFVVCKAEISNKRAVRELIRPPEGKLDCAGGSVLVQHLADEEVVSLCANRSVSWMGV